MENRDKEIVIRQKQEFEKLLQFQNPFVDHISGDDLGSIHGTAANRPQAVTYLASTLT